MATNEARLENSSASDLVTVSDWNACYNRADGIIALSCKVSTTDSSATISGVGLILNNSNGQTLASFYTELSTGNESVTPALNLPPTGLNVGDTVQAVVSGEVGKQQHYFFEEKLTIGKC